MVYSLFRVDCFYSCAVLFSSRRRHTRLVGDWSSDVCSSDLASGGKCPAGVPAKQYDVSMINVEITLNRWLDFFPGYMYVLTQDLDKVRGEEAKNKAARSEEHTSELQSPTNLVC